MRPCYNRDYRKQMLMFSERMASIMKVSYIKLWHMLLDRNMKKKDLQEKAGLTNYAMLKLSRNENVSTEIIGKICRALDCTTDQIIEFIPEKEE